MMSRRRPFDLEYTPGGQKNHKWSKRDDEVRHVQRIFDARPAGEWANCVYRPECQIVSAELWGWANAMARVTAATSPRSSKEPRLLKGLVYHEAPHGPAARHLMHAHAGKKRRARYACTHRAGSGAKVCWYAVRAEP